MKKIAALLLTAVMMLTFSSCASTELELKNRIIVEAIGIDYCDIGVRVTVQFLNADQSSNPNNGGTPDDIVKNMTIDSQNISSAIQSISKTLGKLPMMSQNRVIIFGNEAAKAGVGKVLDYFVRNSDNRATVYAAVPLGKQTSAFGAAFRQPLDVLFDSNIEKFTPGSRLLR